MDDPLLAIRRDANNAPLALLYYVMDGMGRQYSAAGPDGRLLPDWIPGTGIPAYTDWTYSGGTARAQGFSAERFTGQSAATANLSFFRNRAYDARTGRWTQEDPIGLAGGVNLYQFNNNDPVNYTDPFGLCIPWPQCAFAAAGAGARAGTVVGGVVGTVLGGPGPGTVTGVAVGRAVGAVAGFGVAVGGALILWNKKEERVIRGLIHDVTGVKATDETYGAVSDAIHDLKAHGEGGTANERGDFTKEELRKLIEDVLGPKGESDADGGAE